MNIIGFSLINFTCIHVVTAVCLNEKSKKIIPYDNPTPSTSKIVPTFGRTQKISKKSNKQTVTKLKKFVPPIKHSYSNKDIVNEEIESNNAAANEPSQLYDEHIEPQSYMNQRFDISQYHDDNFVPNSNMPMNESTEDNAEFTQKSAKDTAKNKKKSKDSFLGGVILGSLNVLNDEEFQILSQESHASDQSSVKNLQHVESFCSVISLNKTYKNLDYKSFEKVAEENGAKKIIHKIPEGEEFLNLFRGPKIKKKTKKYIAMTTEFEDIGPNSKYSDYIKNSGYIFDLKDEEKETCSKILEMYPKENAALIKMNILK